VTAGLGVPSTLTWNGSSSTAPEIPAGVASDSNSQRRPAACDSTTLRSVDSAQPVTCYA